MTTGNDDTTPAKKPHLSSQPVVTAAAAGSVIFSPMEQMEELDVASAYCYEDDVASLEKALGIDLQDPNNKELLAK